MVADKFTDLQKVFSILTTQRIAFFELLLKLIFLCDFRLLDRK